MSSFASLDAVTVAGPGLDLRLARATARHTMIVTVAGAPRECAVMLQGSHDGYVWTDIGNVQSTSGGMISTGADGALVSHVRADLRTLTGSGTVTASIASDDGT
jgi:hypothetical protein